MDRDSAPFQPMMNLWWCEAQFMASIIASRFFPIVTVESALWSRPRSGLKWLEVSQMAGGGDFNGNWKSFAGFLGRFYGFSWIFGGESFSGLFPQVLHEDACVVLTPGRVRWFSPVTAVQVSRDWKISIENRLKVMKLSSETFINFYVDRNFQVSSPAVMPLNCWRFNLFGFWENKFLSN